MCSVCVRSDSADIGRIRASFGQLDRFWRALDPPCTQFGRISAEGCPDSANTGQTRTDVGRIRCLFPLKAPINVIVIPTRIRIGMGILICMFIMILTIVSLVILSPILLTIHTLILSDVY